MARKCDRLIIAESAAEAVTAKDDQPQARFLGGGTSLFADVGPAGDVRVPLISIRRVPELAGIRSTDDVLDIGASTTAAQLLLNNRIHQYSPLLAQAARSLASRQIRNRATVGGNISTARADHTLVPALLACEASVQVATPTGPQTRDLFDHLQSIRASHSSSTLVTGVSVRRVAGFTSFTRVGGRNGPCYATVSTAIVVDPHRRAVRLAIGNAHQTTFRATAAETLAESAIDWETPRADPELCAEFGSTAADECDPVTDLAASADYRRHAVGVMARRLLEQALQATARGGRPE